MATRDEIHPCVVYGEKRGWDYARTAKFFGISYGVFKQMVRGFTGCSLSRADGFEKRSKGEIRSIEVLRWHERNRREVGGSASGNAA